MAYSLQTRRTVRDSYVVDHLPLAQCSRRHNIPLATIKSWKKKDTEAAECWDELRAARALQQNSLDELTPELVNNFSQLYRTCLTALNDEKIPAIQKVQSVTMLADAFVKFTGAASRAAPKLHTLTLKLETISEFVEFVQRDFPASAPHLLEALEAFGAEVQRKHG